VNKTEQRKMIDQGEGFGTRRRNRLWIDEVNGSLLATNSYWMAPADWFADAIPGAIERGAFDIKAGARLDDDVPNMAALLPRDGVEQVVLEPMFLHGSPVVLDRPLANDLALFVGPADEADLTVALDRRYVAMFRGEGAKAAGSELQFRQDRRSPLKCVSVYRSSSYTLAHGPTETTWSLLGLIMPVRLER
jgi:hypothetical protein